MKIVKAGFEILSPTNGPEIIHTIERAARTCYKSNSSTFAESLEFVRKLIKNGHEAMIEHAPHLSVKFICDRGISHEIVRHRLFSFAQESTRYCDYLKNGEVQVICPVEITVENSKAWATAVETACDTYNLLRERGVSPQIARSVLPTALKTELIVTGNYREWRHFLKLRTKKSAHPQMRELTIPLLIKLQNLVPVLFEDIHHDC